MKDYFFVVKTEYIKCFDLHGSDLFVFSLIATVYRTGSRYNGTTKMMAYVTGCSVRTIERSLNRLIDELHLIDRYNFAGTDYYSLSVHADDKLVEYYDKLSRQIDEKNKEANKKTLNNNINNSKTDLSIEDKIYLAKAKWIDED